MGTQVYDTQMYNYMRNTVVPLLQSISNMLNTINNSINSVTPWLQRGLALAVFIFLYFMMNKLVQSIMYR